MLVIRKRLYRVRAGVSSIEFAMFIPVLIAFASATMFVIRVHQAQQRSALDATMIAAEKAEKTRQSKQLGQLPSWTGADSPDLVQLVQAFQPKLDIKAGLAVGHGEVATGGGIAGNDDLAVGPASADTEFLSHSWETDVLLFPVASDQQRPLTFPASVRGVAKQLSDLTEFTKLALVSVGGRASHSAVTVIADVPKGVSSDSQISPEGLSQTQQHAIQTARRELNKLRDEILRLEQEIADLAKNPVENADLIESASRKLRKMRTQRKDLEEALKLD